MLLILTMKNTNITKTKPLFFINNVDINKIVLSNKVLFGEIGFKYFIGQKIRRLCIFLPKMSAYRTDFDE